jgi:hypothetical protein
MILNHVLMINVECDELIYNHIYLTDFKDSLLIDHLKYNLYLKRTSKHPIAIALGRI